MWIHNRTSNNYLGSISASLNAEYGYNVSIAKHTTVLDDVKIGDYSYVNNYSYIENCTIGKFCSISSGVRINPYEHWKQGLSTHPFFTRRIDGHEKRKSIIIGNDVLISLNVVIIKGVTIGNGAIIGAGAVVTHDVQPYEIVGGVPAKHIGWRFSSYVIEKLQTLQWWNYDYDELSKLDINLICNCTVENIENFLK